MQYVCFFHTRSIHTPCQLIFKIRIFFSFVSDSFLSSIIYFSKQNISSPTLVWGLHCFVHFLLLSCTFYSTLHDIASICNILYSLKFLKILGTAIHFYIDFISSDSIWCLLYEFLFKRNIRFFSDNNLYSGIVSRTRRFGRLQLIMCFAIWFPEIYKTSSCKGKDGIWRSWLLLGLSR